MSLEPVPSPSTPTVDHPLMQHRVRQAIVAWVQDNPGGHLGELVRTLRLGWGNAHHHLDRMVAAGLVIQEAESNRVHLFLPGQVPHEDRRLFSVLEHDCLRTVASIVNDNPGINQRRLAEELGVTPTAARKHVRRLIQEGILESMRQGKQVQYAVAVDISEAIGNTSGRHDAMQDEPFATLSGLSGAIDKRPSNLSEAHPAAPA